MAHNPDYILDIPSLNRGASSSGEGTTRGSSGSVGASGSSGGGGLRGRPWIAVDWQCCHVYSRIYRSADGSCYKGNCPSCGAPVQAQIGEGGTSKRFFQAK